MCAIGVNVGEKGSFWKHSGTEGGSAQRYLMNVIIYVCIAGSHFYFLHAIKQTYNSGHVSLHVINIL